MAIGGLDIGTSGCKFSAFDLDGNVIWQGGAGYSEYGTDGIREIAPLEVWDAVCRVLSCAASECPEKIEGFAVTSLGESAVVTDHSERPLYRSMVTGDKRGIEESRELISRFGKKKLMDLTGVPPSEMYALPKFLWLAKHTEVFKQAKYLFLYEDYIAYRLTGQRKVSYSSASRTMAFDFRKKEWVKELLETAGIDRAMMSHPVPSGTIVGRITKAAAELTGLSTDTILVAGGHDQMCAALGEGVLDSEAAGDGMGTCEVMAVPVKKVRTDSYMIENELACIPYVEPDTYLTYLVLTNCGVLMNWYRDTFFPREHLSDMLLNQNLFEFLDRQTGEDPTGLLVIPNFGSAGNPHVDYNAKGVIWGLTIHTRQHEIFKAVKEGMAYHMRLCMESLQALQPGPKRIHVSGGGARSDMTLQLRADVMGIPVCQMENPEAGARGCMMLTGAALKKYRHLKEAAERTVRISKIFKPNRERQVQYEQLFQKYKSFYDTIHNFK